MLLVLLTSATVLKPALTSVILPDSILAKESHRHLQNLLKRFCKTKWKIIAEIHIFLQVIILIQIHSTVGIQIPDKSGIQMFNFRIAWASNLKNKVMKWTTQTALNCRHFVQKVFCRLITDPELQRPFVTK